MPKLPVVYIRPEFKTEFHSFFQDSERRPLTCHYSSMLSCTSVALLIQTREPFKQSEGKMSFLTITLCLLVFVYDCSAVDIMPQLKKNILNFGYRVNFKYEGMLSHSFDRFHIVTKFELLKTKDLKLATFGFDFEYSYANHMTTSNTNYVKLLSYCMKTAPYT